MCGRSVDFGDLGGRRERTQFAKRGMCKRCLDMSRDGEVELDYSTFMAFVQSHPGDSPITIQKRETKKRVQDGSLVLVHFDVELSTFDTVRDLKVSMSHPIGVTPIGVPGDHGAEWLKRYRSESQDTVGIFKDRLVSMGCTVEVREPMRK